MNRTRSKRGKQWLRFAVSGLLVGITGYPVLAAAQERQMVTGTVVDGLTAQPLGAVGVRLAGTGVGTLTDASGRYMIQAPPDGTLIFTRIGYREAEIAIANRARVDVQLEVSAARIEELVVTGYQTQRRGDITGAVSSVDVEAIERQSSSSVLHRLAGTVPGVVVESSGSPGARSLVRIRGVSSFQNNGPLYIIDGTPVEDSFANFLNPNDIESIQVLKDASAASIYGSRANNGVVIIETKKGRRGAPQVAFDAQFGFAQPIRGYDDFLILNPLEYAEVVRRSYVNAGLEVPETWTAIYGDPGSPSVAPYIYAAGPTITGRDQWGRVSVDESRYSFPNTGGDANCCLIMPGNPNGTNWWKEVFGTGEVRDMNLAVRGGGENERYALGLSFFDQTGTARFNRYQRGTIRVNTDFNVGRFTIGENFSVSVDESYGGLTDGPGGYAEDGIMGKNILMQSVIPVRDIQGNYASGKAQNLGNMSNPVKRAQQGEDQRFRSTRLFGNAFVRMAITDYLSANTSLSINNGTGTGRWYDPIFPENSEPNMIDQINENSNSFSNYTWNNTLNFQDTFADRHNLSVLVGQEAIRSEGRFIGASMRNMVTLDPNARYINPAVGDPGSRNVNSSGGKSALLSFFGKADYNFDERYYLSGTLRRDGSSRLGEEFRWGTFPAVNVGWRVSQEAFMADNTFINNLMLRFGWGITGNQNIAAGRTVDHFGGSVGTSFYDITGSGSSVARGFRQTAIGNPLLKWEENQSVNVGMDVEFLRGQASLALDVYQRDSDNLLFNPPLPATAGAASVPIVNVGQMRNRGIDVSFGYRGTLGRGIGWNMDLNAAHYRNEIVRIDGERDFFFGPISTRFATQSVTINQVGSPVGTFFGFIHDGIYQSQQEIDQLNEMARQRTGDPNAVYHAGARPGRLRFRDVNGDGVLNADDMTVIGNPHPDLTAGLHLGLTYRNFDFSTDFFGSFGNDIFDVQKEFYVFRHFNANVRRDLLTQSAVVDTLTMTVTNPGAKYPRLDVNDGVSREPSTFYVEDGSYVRLRALQIGYRIPAGRLGGLGNTRVYVRGENLFTITGYSGLDPSLPASNVSAAGMDVADQARGIDRGAYPTNRTVSVGFNVSL